MSDGVSARDLSDDDLLRELAQVKTKAPDIEGGGTAHQKANLKDRTAELEEEFLRRNPAPGAEGSPAPDSGETGGAAAAGAVAGDAAATTAADDGARDHAAEDSAPGAAADSSAPSVTGEPADDPNQPDNLL